MARIALLIQKTPVLEDGNYLRLGRELARMHHEVDLLSVDSLRMSANRIIASGFAWSDSYGQGTPFPLESLRQIEYDLLWVLAAGLRKSFLDRVQLLQALPEQVQVINSVDALMFLRSKYLLAANPDLFPTPETHASSDARELLSIIQREGGQWIIKPPAGSLGQDVYLVRPDDQNLGSILQQLCGEGKDQYTMIQRYLPQVEQGEKRVLLAAGQVIGQYLRRATDDHRTNLSRGAVAEACDLTPAERALCTELAGKLLERGAIYSGIDLVYPHLIEVNVINPGGLTTIENLTGENLAPRVAGEVTRRLL